MEIRKTQAMAALTAALEAAIGSDDAELAGALATAFYWAAGATNPALP